MREAVNQGVSASNE